MSYFTCFIQDWDNCPADLVTYLRVAAFQEAAQKLGQLQGLLLAALKAGTVAAGRPQPAQPAAVALQVRLQLLQMEGSSILFLPSQSVEQHTEQSLLNADS